MPRSAIELISPATVYNRVIGGIVVMAAAFIMSFEPGIPDEIIYVTFAIGAILVATGWRMVQNPRLAIRYAWNRLRTVTDLIEEWKPRDGEVESDYEKSLHDFLKRQLTFVKITRQYGAGRIKCDIAIGKDVMLELKMGIRSTSKLQRLLGQIDLYRREWNKPIVVVLLGESDEDLLHDLHRSLNRYGRDIEVITKSVATPLS